MCRLGASMIFSPVSRRMVVSPTQEDDSIWINQDAWYSLCDLKTGHEITYSLKHSGNGIYFFLISGELSLADETLKERDGIALSEVEEVQLKANSDCEILVIDVPLKRNDDA